MRKVLLGAAGLLAMPLLLSQSAHATLISIGLQEGGSIVTEATDAATPGSAVFSGSFGTFNLNTVTAAGSPALPSPNLDTTSINATSTAAGTINVFITESNLTTPTGVLSFLSSFTSNLFNGAAKSVVESTYISKNNVLYGGTQLASASFTGSGLNTSASTNSTPNLTGPYSETIEYTITVGAGTSDVNDTVDVTNETPTQVPEPATLALLGSGLLGLGLLRRRKSV